MHPSDIKLVITVALKKEIPAKWLESNGVLLLSIAALKSGALSANTSFNKGILVVITGVGLKTSKEAAHWIKDNLDPLYVLNIGTCGLTEKGLSLCEWIRPEVVLDENDTLIKLDDRLPVPIHEKSEHVHALLSVKNANFHGIKSSKHCQAVDMECFAQAKVFIDTQTSFHCLKFGTDYADQRTISDFSKNLKLFNNQIKNLFRFFISASHLTTSPLSTGDTLGFNNIRSNLFRSDITAIMPVYNRKKTIKRAIDSILSQSLPPGKIIVVDDCSTDGTRKILENYGDKISTVYLSKNSGPSKARNEGIKHTQTEWITFMDSDDCWEKDKLKKQVAYLRKYPFYEIIQSEEKWVRNGVRVNPRKYHKKREGWIWEPSLERCLISPSGVLVKKSLLEQYGCFDETLPVCEDYDLWLKISRYHPVGLVQYLDVIKYGGHKDQLSHKYKAMDRFRIQSMLGLLRKETNPEFRKKLRDVMTKKLDILIQGYRKRGKTGDLEDCIHLLKSIE